MRLYGVEELHRHPADCGRQAAEPVSRQAPGWWLHIDLDVLAGSEFSACGAARDAAMPGGLTWAELSAVTKSAGAVGGCSGWSLGVYNTDLDPKRQAAARIVRFVRDVSSSWA